MAEKAAIDVGLHVLLYGAALDKAVVSLHTHSPIAPLPLACPQCGTAASFRVGTETRGRFGSVEDVPAYIECTVCDTEWEINGVPRAIYPYMIERARKE